MSTTRVRNVARFWLFLRDSCWERGSFQVLKRVLIRVAHSLITSARAPDICIYFDAIAALALPHHVARRGQTYFEVLNWFSRHFLGDIRRSSQPDRGWIIGGAALTTTTGAASSSRNCVRHISGCNKRAGVYRCTYYFIARQWKAFFQQIWYRVYCKFDKSNLILYTGVVVCTRAVRNYKCNSKGLRTDRFN